MKSEDAVQSFPFDQAGLDPYAAIILSDIGSNSLLLPAQVWLRGETVPNRLKLIRDWTAKGRGLVMVGGYLSFRGIHGRARWRRTAVEEALPVECLPYDDRVEMPEGMHAEIVDSRHPILAGVGTDWPALLGVNEVQVKSGKDVRILARVPRNRAGILCWWSVHPAKAAAQLGLRTSGRTGCQSALQPGRALPAFGAICSLGFRRAVGEASTACPRRCNSFATLPPSGCHGLSFRVNRLCWP